MTFYNNKPAEIGCRGGNGNHEPLALGNFGRLVSGYINQGRIIETEGYIFFCHYDLVFELRFMVCQEKRLHL